jgi:hypothetical protein
MDEAEARAAIKAHFAEAGRREDQSTEIYSDDAVIEFPQGGERIRGRANILAFRTAYPASLDFDMRRTIGCGDIWVNEYTIRYDGKPSNVVGIMEFSDGKVVRETIYVGDPWDPPAWRSQWVEPIT